MTSATEGEISQHVVGLQLEGGERERKEKVMQTKVAKCNQSYPVALAIGHVVF